MKIIKDSLIRLKRQSFQRDLPVCGGRGNGGLVCGSQAPLLSNFLAISNTERFSLTLPSLQLSIWRNCRAFA